MKTIIAIDPGQAGGIALSKWASDPNPSVWAVKMPDTHGDLITILSIESLPRENCVLYIEELVKHMGAGIPASTMAVYASNWGVIIGAAMALQIKIIRVTPREWQEGLGLGISGKHKVPKGATPEQKKVYARHNDAIKRDWKNKLKQRAQELYPQITVTLKNADALLILAYASRQEALGQ